jgi:thiol-disulfide isomerase/thioredoxin
MKTSSRRHFAPAIRAVLWMTGWLIAAVPSAAPLDAAEPAASAKPDATTLVGRPAAEVQALLGKPMGRLQTAAGPLWLYPDWKVQFDPGEKVLKVERDAPVRLPQATPDYLARAEAIAKAKRQRDAENSTARIAAAAAAGSPSIRVVSNRGATVDLPALLFEGKVTIVDFYADWCGPCRAVAPELEQFVKDNPNVALVKIDIVNWETPVTKQFAISSVPNLRVYGRNKQPVGEPTSDFDAVRKLVKKASGS